MNAGAKTLRRFSTWEITRYLIPVAQAHFRRVLRQNPDLPQGLTETEGGAKWFTLDEVLRLRAHFAAEGSKAKDYRPYRPEGLPAKIVAVANFKGGVGKTSTAAHLAMSAALDGYRVLVVDLDSQGSMTSIFGGRIADEWQTAFPLLARHYAEYLRRRTGRGRAGGRRPKPRRDAHGGAQRLCGGSDPAGPLAQYRSHRRAARSLLGGVPDPRLADAGARLEAVGRARRPAGGRRGAERV
jgi:chromosome partitioning protein